MNALILLTALLSIFASNPCNSADWKLATKSSWTEKDGWALEFDLSNTNSKSIKTFASYLPWGIKESLYLVVVPLAENTPQLKAPTFSENSRFDPIVVEVGQTISGRILLNQRFPELPSTNKQFSVAACFSYSFARLLPGSVQVEEGCVILPKRSDK